MTRRFASVTLLSILGLLAVVSTAEAVSSRTRLCIKAARDARKRCVLTCGTDFQGTFASCFGPGADCAAGCITEQSNCLLDPVSARTACQKDTDPNPNDGIAQGACSVRLRDDLECCGDATCPDQLDPDPIQCASKARLKGIECNQDCQLLYAPQTQACSTQFNDCTQSCASCRRPGDCPTPAARRAR
ncbi:MAG TPA: hypothetical protein VKA21_11010 [Candidatus Binatia bacterium]|nr:hypothetical protein [Candidatus Binatia bacterium]